MSLPNADAPHPSNIPILPFLCPLPPLPALPRREYRKIVLLLCYLAFFLAVLMLQGDRAAEFQARTGGIAGMARVCV